MVPVFILHKAVVAFCTTTWLAFHRIAMNRGFTFRRRGLSTDTLFSLAIGLSTTAWTGLFLAQPLLTADENSLSELTRASQTPLLLVILFVFWLVIWIDGRHAVDRGYDKFALWNLSAISGPFEWIGSLSTSFSWLLYVSLWITIMVTSTAAIMDGLIIQGVLNIVGVIIFSLSGAGPNPYAKAAHRYSGDMPRVILPTSHHEGTVYVLPSEGYGFDAVWSPKVDNEHTEADQQAMAIFASVRSSKWALKEPLERIRHIVASYQTRVVMKASHLEALARWLYLEDAGDELNMRSIRCQRAPNTHLIGRDLMYALCHAEYLVFMGQGQLPPYLQQKLGTLRLMKRSGASLVYSSGAICIGYKPGLSGYQEAVEYVYMIFDQPFDQSSINFVGTSAPKYSGALSKSPSSIQDYVSELWDLSCTHSESTFTALYMFTLVWSIEMGNCNGFHIFPFRCMNRNGDLVSQQIVWRQAWYCGIICQLVSASPLLFAAFIAGYLG